MKWWCIVQREHKNGTLCKFIVARCNRCNPLHTTSIPKSQLKLNVDLKFSYQKIKQICNLHYLYITLVAREIFRKMIQTKCWTSICTCYKWIIGITTKYRTLSSSIFTTKNQFLFRCSCCCHINFVTSIYVLRSNIKISPFNLNLLAFFLVFSLFSHVHTLFEY